MARRTDELNFSPESILRFIGMVAQKHPRFAPKMFHQLVVPCNHFRVPPACRDIVYQFPYTERLEPLHPQL
jgi:hypothetical protein